ncbi:tudor domain-containing protein 5-like [Ixodes scapularis]|uniref:tudor domain-containing protein 5-like n=1 Tax=Ixodes scapularis TaxID=6945 RepID=UPI001C3813A5|nr:tudor domain-containing protein 5-like [Ixodes scapularis]
MAGRLRDLETIKFVIRALLMVNNGPTPYGKFLQDYRRTEGHHVPYHKYGCTDCLDFLRTLTDTVHVKQQGSDVLLFPNLDDNAGESVRHVQELIKAQKVEPVCEDQRKRPENVRPTRGTELHLPDNVQRNLQSLVSKFMHGICVDALEDAYLREFGTTLNVKHFGFDSLKQALSTVKFFDLVDMPNDKIKVRLHSSNDRPAKMAARGKSPTTDVAKANGHAHSAKSPDARATGTSLLRNNIQKVLERRTDGIFMSSFSQAYTDEIGEPLSVGTMQLVQRWPDLFHIVRPDSSSDFILFPGTLGDLEDSSTEGRSSSSPDNTSDVKYSPVQLPADRTEEYFPVRVSYVGSPGRFAIQPVGADGYDPLSALTREMSELYSSDAGHRYAVVGTRSAVLIGQAYAALYSSVDDNTTWYRARVTGVSSLYNVEVELVDFGNHCTVHRSELRKLRDDFLELPVQCARAALAFLRPRGDDWCESAYKCFLQLSADRILMCKVESEEGETLKVLLCDTNGDEEHFIHDVLVSKGFALCDFPHEQTNGVAEVEREHVTPATGKIDVRLVQLSDGSAIHVIGLRSQDYVTSQEMSSLVGWREDRVLEELRKKEISLGHLVVRCDQEPELFRKIGAFAPGDTVCLFRASNIVDIINLFNYPSAKIVAEVKRLFEPLKGAESLGGSKVRKRGAVELKHLKKQLAAANDERRQIYSSFGAGATNLNHVDVLQGIEARITELKKQIDKLCNGSS